MKEQPQNGDRLLADYLLGKLPEAEEGYLEEQYVADAQMQHRLAQMEDELVDRYLEGQLSQEERTQFEARFLKSPRGSRKLEIARSLIVVASQAAKEKEIPKSYEANAQRLPSLLAAWPIRFALAALALVLLLVLAWSIKNRLSHENQIVTQPAPTTNPTNGQREAPLTSSVASIILEPVTREVLNPPEVKIRSGAHQVRFQLELKGNRKSYTAKLLSYTGKTKWTAHDLQSQSTTSGQALVLTLPTNLLDNGEYTILLSSAETPATPVAEYAFVVLKVKDHNAKD